MALTARGKPQARAKDGTAAAAALAVRSAAVGAQRTAPHAAPWPRSPCSGPPRPSERAAAAGEGVAATGQRGRRELKTDDVLSQLSSIRRSSMSWVPAASAPRASEGAPECDVALYADLLRRANGDHATVAIWLSEMGFKYPDPSIATAASAQVDIDPPPAPKGGARWPMGGPAGDASPPPAAIAASGGGAKSGGSGSSPGGGVYDSAWSSLAATRGSPARPEAVGADAGADLDSRAADAGAPRHFFCPISLQIMRDPVIVTATGQTYDRACIERWLRQGNHTCPASGQAISPPAQLVPNVALRNSIEEWAERHAPWLLGHHGKIKPLPKEDLFGTVTPAAVAAGTAAAARGPASATDPDLALAIRMQQQELDRLAAHRQATAGYGAAAAGGAAFGAAGAAAGGPPPPPAGMRSASSFRPPPPSAGSSMQRSRSGGAAGPPPPGYAPSQLYNGAAPAAAVAGAGGGPRGGRLRNCLSFTTCLLFTTQAAWIALFIVSLGKNGWSMGDLSLNPWAGADQASLLDVGAQQAQLVLYGGQWWRLFSSPFVNAGVIQMLLNMSVLWTLGRHLEYAFMRRLPGFSIAAIYLLGSFLGALTSANLNSQYVTCGASAGVCSLLGATWADQLANAKRYVHRWWTLAVLVVVTAIFVVMSLLPLLDPWYTSAALLTGFVFAPVLLLAPKPPPPAGQRQAPPGGKGRAFVRLLCAALVAAGYAVCIAGVVTKADVGSQTEFLQDGSCLTFGHWQCLPAGSSPNGCKLVQSASGGAPVLQCPAGVLVQLPNGTTILPGDTSALTQNCFKYCALSGGAQGGGGGGGFGASPPPPAGGATPVPGGGTGSGGVPCSNATEVGGGGTAPVLC